MPGKSKPKVSAALVPARGSVGLARRPESIVDSFWQGRSERTVRAYKADLARIAAWAGWPSIETFAMFFFSHKPGEAYKLAHEFRAWALAAGPDKKAWSPSYVNNHLSALRALVKFARRINFIEWALDIEDAKAQAFRDTRGPGFSGLVDIVNAAAAQTDPFTAARDTAITTIFATMGLRLDEVHSLDLEHVDARGRRLLVKRKKKLQRVWVTIPVETLGAVKLWLEIRGKEPGPLFLSRSPGRRRADGRLAYSSIWKIVSELAASVGLKAWPHGMRHAAITQVLDTTNGNMRAAQKFADHGSINTTQRYDDNRKDLAGEMSGMLAKAITKARKGETK